MQTKQGLVVKSVGNSCQVITLEGTSYQCLVKGNLRIKGIRTTNPVVVGDTVLFSPSENEGEITYIQKILPRRNYIIRKASNLSKESQILAANIDCAFLIVTVHRPATSFVFIDRFLATAEAYSVPVHLVFNKVDELTLETEQNLLKEYQKIYSNIGYPCHSISALHHTGIEELYPLLEGKITLLSGHSGVGKSTLINTLLPEAKLKTGAISQMHETGMHTTTYSQMLPLEGLNGGYIIDTPGIKGFGTLEMNEANTAHYFREFFEKSKDCRFANCTHLREPGCAVLQALEEGHISSSRYNSYLSILDDQFEGSYRNDL
ncbi:MAG: ribosome small subunit-dependent GTPase A [Porphyromonas sp.]|nr:ribosome small subunit-dependent GTPase A [Porphyromonas sp.]